MAIDASPHRCHGSMRALLREGRGVIYPKIDTDENIDLYQFLISVKNVVVIMVVVVVFFYSLSI